MADGLWNFEPDKHRAIVFLCDLRFSFPCSSRGTAELRGCDRKRFSSAALNKNEEDPVIRGGRVGLHCRDCGERESGFVRSVKKLSVLLLKLD